MSLPLLLLTVVLSAEPLEHGLHDRSLTVGDLEREYLVYVPAAEPPREGYPLVIAYHGGGSHARGFVEFCGLNETADEHGFVVAYPNGTGRLPKVRTFNGGNCCGYAQRQEVDDVAFTKAMIDDIKTDVTVDGARIYATGMSNGAIMSYRVADQMADIIAAIAPVAGPMGTAACDPSHPVPVCHFHGTEDDFAAYEGGFGKRSVSRTDFYSVQHSLTQWAKANGCRAKPKVTKLESKVDDGTSIERHDYLNGEGRAMVVHYKINGGGHTWPGQAKKVRFLGKVTENLNANEAMWQFFRQHKR